MKLISKMLFFVAMFGVAIFLAVPVKAKADVTINVVKPSDWNSVSVHAWTKSGGDITSWPGMPLSQSGDKYTITIKAKDSEKVSFILNNGGNGSQTVNIDGITCTDGKGDGLSAGVYNIIIGTEKNSNGSFKWTMETLEQLNTSITQVSSSQNTAQTVENNQVPAASSPKTADRTTNLIIFIGLIGVVSSMTGVILRRKLMP